MYKRAVVIFLIMLVVSCQDHHEVSGLQFARIWQDAYSDSGISWWYLGEDRDFFYLQTQSPDSETAYKVPKSAVVINGIERMERGASEDPVRLLVENLEFL